MTTAAPIAALALALVVAGPTYAAAGPPAGPIERSAHREAARQADASSPQAPPAARRRNWVQRHPVWTAALVGGATGFLIGYLPGDDGVFYDYTAGFNGMVVGGIGAGGAACVVAVTQAFRRR